MFIYQISLSDEYISNRNPMLICTCNKYFVQFMSILIWYLAIW